MAVRKRLNAATDKLNAKDPNNGPITQEKLSRRFQYVATLAILLIALAFGYWFTFRVSGDVSEAFILCAGDGGYVYTVDSYNTRTECIVVDDGRIDDVGSLSAIKYRRETGLGTQSKFSVKVRYVKAGAIIVPGLSDSHAHILEYGAKAQLPLSESKTIKDTLEVIRSYILSNPSVLNDTTKFIRGGGWDNVQYGGWPSADDLESDPVIRGRPVVLQSKDCHALWLSPKAMEKSLPFPQEVDGGVIMRDGKGKPTGLLLDNAQELVKQPALTDQDLLERFHIAVDHALKFGLTAVHDAGLDPISLKFYKDRAALGKLPIRIYGMTYFDENKPYWGNTTSPLIGAADGTLTARSVKIFTDGALRTGGAALHHPYSDNPHTRGVMRLDPKVLFKWIPLFLRDGWQVNVHAIGDRANGITLDAFEASLSGANVSALRPRLEHAQIVNEKDMKRLGKLGVIASIQPSHATSDMSYAEERLGPDRVRDIYAFRSMIDNGARITFGSDAPVDSINPLSGFYAAVTRLTPEGSSPHGPGGWFPEQRLTRKEALRAMTIDPAYASFSEDNLGSLEPGKRADFTILSQDIMTVPFDKILETKVLATVIDGKTAYGNF